MEELKGSVYRRGADNGLAMGLLFILLFAGFVLTEYVSVFSVVALALMASVPFAAFLFLRRSYKKSGYTLEFSALWVEGIVTFTCAGALLAIVVYVTLKWVDPDYMVRQVDAAIEVYENIDDGRAREVLGMLEMIKENNAYPTPRFLSLQLVLTSCFTGSILSMLLGILIKSMRNIKKTKD